VRRTFVPVGQELARYVDRIWTWEGVPEELPSLLPGTGAELVFHRGSQLTAHGADGPIPLPRSHLLCMRRERWRLTADGIVAFTAVRLRAGALACLTGDPVENLIDRVVEIDDLLGRIGRQLSSVLNDSSDLTARAARAEHVLRRQPIHHTDPRIMAAVQRLYRHPASTCLSDLAQALGISTRHLRRGFSAAAGVSPKEFQRLARFQRVIRTMLLDAPSTTVPVALAAGYYDQSHFIKEFHRLAGESPVRMMSLQPPHFYLPRVMSR